MTQKIFDHNNMENMLRVIKEKIFQEVISFEKKAKILISLNFVKYICQNFKGNTYRKRDNLP